MKKRKHKIHWTHVSAVAILAGYFFLSKLNWLSAARKETPMQTFIQLFIFGAFFAVIFLYVFSHEKFFPFAKEVERREKKKEDKYIKKYLHHGKVLATIIVGVIGGPVFSSLTARILINSSNYKYFIVVFSNIISTLFTVGLSRGILHLVSL